VTPRYVKNIFRCASVGPATVEAIMNNECRPDVTLQDLVNELPIEWSEQNRIIKCDFEEGSEEL
jgi:hypothetical protein